jgi:hypothetical protein
MDADAPRPPPAGDPAAPGEAPTLSRTELGFLRQAARQNWGVPDELKTTAMVQIQAILRSESERNRLAAMRTMAVFDRNDLDALRLELAAAKLELERSRLTPPAEAQARDAWESICDAIDAEDTSSPGEATGPSC